MNKCKICDKDVRSKNDLFVIANSLFAKPHPYHKKCYLNKNNEKNIKKKHRLINSEAVFISIAIQLVVVVIFGIILFKSEPDSFTSMIAFPMALIMLVIVAELIQKGYSYFMFERKYKN